MIKTLVTCLLLSAIMCGNAVAQSTTFSNQQVNRFIDGIAERLIPVWEENLKPEINLVPDYAGSTKDLKLKITSTCNWSPNYNPDIDPPTISISKPLLLVSQYLQQAYLIYFLSTDRIITPRSIERYIVDELVPILEKEKSRCVRAKQGESVAFSSQIPSILRGKLTDRAYRDFMSRLEQLPAARLVADFIAANPIFYILLHEAGHHYEDQKGTSKQENTEHKADRFADHVFMKNEMSSTIAMGQLQLFYFEATSKSAKEIRCRISMIASADSQIENNLGRSIPRQIIDRMYELRSFYIQEYGEEC